MPDTSLTSNARVTSLAPTGRAGLAKEVRLAFERAMASDGKLTDAILDLPGMSGRKFRLFINNLVECLPTPRYLEVGLWQGSTFCSAIFGNEVTAVGIDNWSQFGDGKTAFLRNLSRFKGNADVRILNSDYRDVDFDRLGKFNVYFFDGPQSEQDLSDGVRLPEPALDDEFVLVVDDWNWEPVRRGAWQGIGTSGYQLDFAVEIRTMHDNKHAPIYGSKSSWHNGYLIAALRKSGRSARAAVASTSAGIVEAQAVLAPPEPEENWHLTIVNGQGSVEHFFHFLLGFFVPLVFHLSTEWVNARFNHISVRSCGPLDRLLQELDDDRIKIVNKVDHREMTRSAGRDNPSPPDLGGLPAAELHKVRIYGCDNPETFNREKFTVVRKTLTSIPRFQKELHSLDNEWVQGDVRILLIQRGPSLEFYKSDEAEAKGSGQDRRSILNHDALYHSIKAAHVGCRNVFAEQLTLSQQFALFSSADIILAQHGAALANIIWARPGATVVEIFPRTLILNKKDCNLFLDLSRCMGLPYRRIIQNHPRGNVDIARVLKVLGQAVSTCR
jgi:hypothetical protein